MSCFAFASLKSSPFPAEVTGWEGVDAGQRGFFQQLAELLPFAMYVVNPRGRIVFWNDRASQITGYRAHDVVGRRYRDGLFTPCASEGTGPECAESCPIESAIRDGRPAIWMNLCPPDEANQKDHSANSEPPALAVPAGKSQVVESKE